MTTDLTTDFWTQALLQELVVAVRDLRDRVEALEGARGVAPRAYIPASKSVEWGTPPALLAQLAAEFGPFDLDPAASEELHAAPVWFSREVDGLTMPWFGRVFCNPPYGRQVGLWVAKARAEVEAGRAKLAVLLIPAATSTHWWHKEIVAHASVIRELEGRLTFRGASSCAPFASAVVVFEQSKE